LTTGRLLVTGPLLVTGAHRSGTTWVGKMLCASGETAYISEPLNVLHRPGVLRINTPNWYTYINSQNEKDYLAGLQETLSLRYHLSLELGSIRSLKDMGRMFRDFRIFFLGRIKEQRPLVKDPFAVFSAPWFMERLGCAVVIVVRHPAAFVSSLKRLNWSFDFSDILDQPLLMNDWLEPYRRQMETVSSKRVNTAISDDMFPLIEQASLLWRIIYGTVNRFLREIPTPRNTFKLIRHEDLSVDPIGSFKNLYDTLGLHFTDQAKKMIINSTNKTNPSERSSSSIYTVHLDSKANLHNWKKRLTLEEINRIREITADMAMEFYPDSSWE